MQKDDKARSETRARAVRLTTCASAVTLAFALALGVGACNDLTETTSETAATDTTLAVTSTAPTTTEAPVTTTTKASNPVSQESRDYAASLGGTSHKGEKLYFVIGASLGSEAQAKAQLEPAKAVGDTQMYFIVQLSDNFDGMTPGYWVIFEAYDSYPASEDIEWCRRAFPSAYVKSATVLSDDPIPVRPGG